MSSPVQDSPNSVTAHTSPGSAQIITTGFSERWLIVLLILVAFVALVVSIIALRESGETAALREAVTSLRDTVRTNNGKLEVVQYDHNALKAQLVAKGIYQGTEH